MKRNPLVVQRMDQGDAVSRVKARMAAESAAPEPAFDPLALPGVNIYDKAVASGVIDYSTAKTREEVSIAAEKIEQAKIATEQARIALDKERLALQKERGLLLDKHEVLQRQECLIAVYADLIRMVISDASVQIPPMHRDPWVSRINASVNLAMHAASDAVGKRMAKDAVLSAMGEAFRGTDV